MKTKIQITHHGLLTTVKDILKTDGPLGFFKGIGAPLLSIPLINSIVFSTYELSKKFTQIMFHKETLDIHERMV